MANFFQGLRNPFKKAEKKDLDLADCMQKGLITEEEFLRLLKDRANERWLKKMSEIKKEDRKK
jgi:hypothetical protein